MKKRFSFTVLSITIILMITLNSGMLAASGWSNRDSSFGLTTRVSVASDGTQGNWFSGNPSISADGRYVAFDSEATNLVSGDTNWNDVFVHDRQTSTTTIVSVASDGSQGYDDSYNPSISADGRYVAFDSLASDLVSEDTNNYYDIYVHDRQTGTTTIVSVSSDGTQGNGGSAYPSISGDGRYVAFMSYASNLVSGDTNDHGDIFVHDRQTGDTSRVSVTSDGTQGNGFSEYLFISGDGRYVAFMSYASNLVSGDTNGSMDVFVHDRQTGDTSRVSVASDGTQGNGGSDSPSISGDGRYVAFHSRASNLVSGDTNDGTDIFVHDRQTGSTSRVSVASDGTEGNWNSEFPFISADGQNVAFMSNASNLVSEDTNDSWDVFVHDRQTGTTSRVSVASDGTQGNALSDYPSISADGSHVAFGSYANNLVIEDTNGHGDIFVHDRGDEDVSIKISMSVDNSTPKSGEIVTFTIQVTNNMTETMTGGVISDTLPTFLNFMETIILEPSDAGTVGSPPTLVSDLQISAGGNVTVTLPVRVDEELAVGTVITNTASVTCDQVTIAVSGSASITVANAPPVAVDDDGIGFTTYEDTAFTTASVLNNDDDPNGDTLTVQSFDASGTIGEVTDNGDGTFDYDPNGQFEDLDAGDHDTDSFTYTISDGNGGTDSATVTITIDGLDDTSWIYLPLVVGK